MTYLRGIERSAYRVPSAQDLADDRYHRATIAARGLTAIIDALTEIADFDPDHVDEADIREIEAAQSSLEIGITGSLRDRVLRIIKQQHRRAKGAKATTVFGQTMPAHGEG